MSAGQCSVFTAADVAHAYDLEPGTIPPGILMIDGNAFLTAVKCPSCGRMASVHSYDPRGFSLAGLVGAAETRASEGCRGPDREHAPVRIGTFAEEAVAAAADSLLTRAEHEALEMTRRLANYAASEVFSAGPEIVHDWAEFTTHLHAIQNMILAQAAARAYPDRYRLLGEHPANGSREVPESSR